MMVFEASPTDVVFASLSLGISKTEPDFRRLMLPPVNASGLLRSSATNIWSSETLSGLFLAAMPPAVSPLETLIC